ETGDNLTVYRGGQKAVKAEKECILFFDHGTGELRLEQIASNVTVKKTRGDDDNDGLLRTEIQRLRSKARVESDSSEVDHKSSSGSSDSEDDDDDEDAAKASTMSSDDASSGSESGDDDDFQDIEERAIFANYGA
uniref:Ell-associated factor Eaf n=1 Tax=Plectus sambesii TaxID=2011161 RepID=A0A914UQK2_9BILA